MVNEVLIKKFWANVLVKEASTCWPWVGTKWRGGYGRIGDLKAHRISYQIHNGEIQDGMLVCHTCDNPPCVNPSHLFLGTGDDNMKDKAKKGRSARNCGPCLRRRHPQLSSEDVRLAKQRVANGESKRTIAASVGITVGQLNRILNGTSGNKRILSEFEIKDIRKRLLDGQSRSSIATHHKVSKSHIANIANGHRGTKFT